MGERTGVEDGRGDYSGRGATVAGKEGRVGGGGSTEPAKKGG